MVFGGVGLDTGVVGEAVVRGFGWVREGLVCWGIGWVSQWGCESCVYVSSFWRRHLVAGGYVVILCRCPMWAELLCVLASGRCLVLWC